jgi:hypothetical protein
MKTFQVNWMEKIAGKWQSFRSSFSASSITEAIAIVQYGANFQHHEISNLQVT